jgi:hypothetical protein
MHRSTPLTPNLEWVAERDRLLRSYFPLRSANVLDDFREAGLFPSVGAPTFNQRGGDAASGFLVELAPAHGSPTIYYTLDGSDPRLVGGALSPLAIEYTGPIPLTGDVTIRVRALSGTTWSPLDEAQFVVERLDALAGDYNGNGRVEQGDLDLVLLGWGQDASTPPDDWVQNPPSGQIDQNELDVVLLNWGQTAAAAPARANARSAPPLARKVDSPEAASAGPAPIELAQTARRSSRWALRSLAVLDAAFEGLCTGY